MSKRKKKQGIMLYVNQVMQSRHTYDVSVTTEKLTTIQWTHTERHMRTSIKKAFEKSQQYTAILAKLPKKNKSTYVICIIWLVKIALRFVKL